MPKFLDTPQWYNEEQQIVRAWENEDLFFRIHGRTTQKKTKSVTGDDGQPDATYSLGDKTHSYEITACGARPEDQDENIWNARFNGISWIFTFSGQQQIQVNLKDNMLEVDCTDYFSPTGYYQTVSATLPTIDVSYDEYTGHNNHLEIYTKNNTLADLLFTIENSYVEIENTN